MNRNPSSGSNVTLKLRQGSEPASRSSRLSWLDWLGRYNGTQNDPERPPTKSPVPNLPLAQPVEPQHRYQVLSDARDVLEQQTIAVHQNPSSSWLGMWPSTRNAKIDIQETNHPVSTQISHSDSFENKETGGGTPIELGGEPNASNSSWAFWSKSSGTKNASSTHSGELAIAGSKSQGRPEAVVIEEESPKSFNEVDKHSTVSGSAGLTSQKQRTGSTKANSPDKTNDRGLSGKLDELTESETSKATRNLILPSFESTYATQRQNPSMLQQIGSWVSNIGRPHGSGLKRQLPLKEPRKIKKALAIGVHGYFPVAIIQTVIGKGA